MSLSTYSGLQGALAALLNRDDLTPYIPDWITMAEAVFNRRLVSRNFMTTETITVTGVTYPIPTDFVSVVSLWLDQDNGIAMEYVTPDIFDNITDVTGTPRFYTIVGDSFYFACPPSGTFSMRLRYNQKLPALSSTNTTNWLLDRHPDLYLYGAAIHSAPFLNDDPRLVVWEGKFNSLVDEFNRRSMREMKGSRLQTSSGLIDRGFNPSGYGSWR